MLTDDIASLMRTAEPSDPVVRVDPSLVRRLGRRRRTRRRLAVIGGAAAAVAFIGAVVAVVGHTPVDTAQGDIATHEHRSTGLSAYEKRVLRAVPQAYAVDGTVVVPGRLDESSDMNTRLASRRIVGAVRPLPFHGYSGVGYVATAFPYPDFMSDNAPRGSQVVADNGPVALTCTTWPGEPGCTVSMVMRAKNGAYYYFMGLGADHFLRPGAPMELFLDGTYGGRRYRDTVIGGFDGTDATRVVVRLVDGRRVDATIDSGGIHHGDTLFWATAPAAVASVTAYDADGNVVARHRVRSCSDPVDCEVR
jgi:hypothetical protein